MTTTEDDKMVNPDAKDEPSNILQNTETKDKNQHENSQAHPEINMVLSGERQNNDSMPKSDEPMTDEPMNGIAKSEPLSNNNAETAPKNDLVCSEVLQDSQLDNTEGMPDNEPKASDLTMDNQPMNYEARQETQPMDSEVQAETLLVPAAQPEIQPMDTEVQSQQINSEVLPENLPNSGIQTNNVQLSSDVLTGKHIPISDESPNNQPAKSEAGAVSDNKLPEAVAQPNIQPIDTDVQTQTINSEVLPENFPNSGTQTNDMHITSDVPTGNHVPNSDELPNIQQVKSEAEAPSNNKLPEALALSDTQLPDSGHNHHQHANSDALPQSQHANTGYMHDSQLVNFEHLPEYHVVQSETLPSDETLNDNQLADSERMTHHEMVHSETMHHNQIVVADTMQDDHQLIDSQMLPNYEITNLDQLPRYELVTAEPQLNEERTPEVQPNKRRKKKSIVWEHFTIETVSAGCRRACCKQCKQSFAYSTGSKVAGTSHLKRHIAKGACPALLRNQDQNQLTPYTPRTRGGGSDGPKRRYRTPSTPHMMFDQAYQDRCRGQIAKMIIMHDYPLHMVEHAGFTSFVQNLQPQFNLVTFNTVQGDCVAIYLEKKHQLMKFIEGIHGRVCLTLDVWTSNQSVGYVFITGHFIDSDWKLQRRSLNVVMEPYPDSNAALGHAVAACLSDWNLEGRLFSITSNQLSSEAVVENLRPLLSVKNPLVLNGQLLLGNCVARTFSSVANDVLGSVRETVKKIRDSVKYVKTSESHEEKFVNLKEQLQVPSDRSLFVDDQTRWNSTYQMLIAAGELKEVFSCLDTSDPDYKGAPSLEDWKLVETVCAYLKPLYDASNILCTTTQPTAITFFQEVWKLQLDISRSVMSENPFISNLTRTMQEKIDKYWRDCGLVLATAVVMDPRFKMKLVEFSFSKLYGDNAETYIKIVDDGIHELFHEYMGLPLPLTPAYAEIGNAGGDDKIEDSSGLSDHGLTDFDAYIMETTSQHTKAELDQYLDESLLPRVPDFDVLGWWKLNKLKYPTLSKMARDILSIPVSCVPPDSVFHTKVKEMDAYRSSLRPETVEALVCAKDWMQHESLEASTLPLKMVF